jgi:hypothetical protein
MVGGARIELATRAMSTSVASVKLLIFHGFSTRQTADLANLEAVFQLPEFTLNQPGTVGVALS